MNSYKIKSYCNNTQDGRLRYTTSARTEKAAVEQFCDIYFKSYYPPFKSETGWQVMNSMTTHPIGIKLIIKKG